MFRGLQPANMTMPTNSCDRFAESHAKLAAAAPAERFNFQYHGDHRRLPSPIGKLWVKAVDVTLCDSSSFDDDLTSILPRTAGGLHQNNHK
nr:hypothetical protein CFP56_58829 [Quercus suber]